jgi:uridine kinase
MKPTPANSAPPDVPPIPAAERIHLIGIAGGSGAGKSWLAARLQRALRGQAVRLSLDDFYRDLRHLSPRQRVHVNFDHPRAIDWPLFDRTLADLQAGRPVALPAYDFTTHTRTARTRQLGPARFVLVEGLWLWRRPALRRRFGYRIFVDCPTALRRARRLARDLRERGRTRVSILRQFNQQVTPMHKRFVAPQACHAHRCLTSPASTSDVRALCRRLRELGCSACR